jgi:hypothetical protein
MQRITIPTNEGGGGKFVIAIKQGTMPRPLSLSCENTVTLLDNRRSNTYPLPFLASCISDLTENPFPHLRAYDSSHSFHQSFLGLVLKSDCALPILYKYILVSRDALSSSHEGG